MVKGRVIIDSERCKGCELCVSVCSKGGLRMADVYNAKGYRPAVWINPQDACTGCALCATICPDTAITVYRETVTRTPVLHPAAHN